MRAWTVADGVVIVYPDGVDILRFQLKQDDTKTYMSHDVDALDYVKRLRRLADEIEKACK